MLVAGVYGCIAVSLTFGFNIFSGDLQQMYGFTQADMTTISTVGIAFAYFGIPYAFVYDYLGVVPVLVLGLFLITIGTLLMGLAFSGIVAGSVVRLSVFNGIFNFGSGLYDLACVVTVLSHFPTRKGVVVAVMKTYIGLGSAIIGAIQLAYFEGKPAEYFYFLTVVGGFIGVLVLVLVRHPPYVLTEYERRTLSDEEAEKRVSTKAMYLKQPPPSLRFAIGFAIVAFLIIFLTLQSALVAFKNLSWEYRNAFAIVTIFFTLISPIVAMPFNWLNRDWRVWRRTTTDLEAGVTPEPIGDELRNEILSFAEVDYVAPQYQNSFLQSLCTFRLWALFWSLFCTLGTEFVVMNNSRYFFNALSGEEVDDSLNTLLTVLNGTGSALGRLSMSFLEVWSQGRSADKRIPITLSLFLPTTTITIMTVLFLCITNKDVLPLPYLLGALGNGIIAAATILVVNTIYAKDPGLHYNFCFFATTCSSILLNRVLYGEWYTREANKRGVEICLERGCVQFPLLVMLGLNISAFFANGYVHWEYVKLNRRALADRQLMLDEGVNAAADEDSNNSLLMDDFDTHMERNCTICSMPSQGNMDQHISSPTSRNGETGPLRESGAKPNGKSSDGVAFK
ncbi:Nodulin-like [Trypanosoma melophagium]|uniref:Nodulin-like n=1 Tax=Trypanosoma melophagium TaxID=715481 RepID=UPI00351A4854|nr:Nodulin-like [Trypanosoma melophagium]